VVIHPPLTAHYHSTSLCLPKLFDIVSKGKDLMCHLCPWFMVAIAAWKMCACADKYHAKVQYFIVQDVLSPSRQSRLCPM
jgi:capsular polysaccharide biosynthesis protein